MFIEGSFAQQALLQFIGGLPGALVVGVPAAYLLWRQHRQYQRGDMKDVVLVVANIFEDSVNDRVTMKPRTIISSKPVIELFPNPAMAKAVVTAARKAKVGNPETALITQKSYQDSVRIGKKMVDICSATARDGHLARMFKHPITKDEGYACMTLAKDGDVELIRIDLIAKNDLQRFLNPSYRKSLRARQSDQSHDDMAAVFEICAADVFDKNDPLVENSSLLASRVSLPREIK